MNDLICHTCGERIYWSDDADAWYHWDLTAILACPAEKIEPVGVTA